MLKPIRDIDFGTEDARNLIFRADSEEELAFISTYLVPDKLDVDAFLSGRRSYVFGLKGTGKSAILKYLEVIAKRLDNAFTEFFFFQSSFRQADFERFLAQQEGSSSHNQMIDNRHIGESDYTRSFWRLLFLTRIAKRLNRESFQGPQFTLFLKAVMMAQRIAQADAVKRQMPALKSLIAELSRDPKLIATLEADDSKLTYDDLLSWLDVAETCLTEVDFESSPIFLFIDELEFNFQTESSKNAQIHLLRDLILVIRDYREMFTAQGAAIYLIAAVRSEVLNQISAFGYEINKVVRDLGYELKWQSSNNLGELHPLFKIALMKIGYADGYSEDQLKNDQVLRKIYGERFAKKTGGEATSKFILDKTWYRPRDISIVFNCMKDLHQKDDMRFIANIVRQGANQAIGEQLWEDAISGLSGQYSQVELNGIAQIIKVLGKSFSFEQAKKTVDELSHVYDGAALLTDKKLADVLSDLYQVGALGMQRKSDGHYSFRFRGDTQPPPVGDFVYALHQMLRAGFRIS